MKSQFAALMMATLLITGCGETPVEKLKRQYEMMERARVSKDELCAQRQKIAQAILEAEDEENYEYEKLMADVECKNIELERRLGL